MIIMYIETAATIFYLQLRMRMYVDMVNVL